MFCSFPKEFTGRVEMAYSRIGLRNVTLKGCKKKKRLQTKICSFPDKDL